ncbi:MAG: ArnT family glycosyltransferase [Candidatus Hodarchaeales archaeon]
MNNRTIAYTFLIIGITCWTVGFIIHCINPSEIYAQHQNIEEGQIYIERINVNNINFKSEYKINLRVNVLTGSNYSVYLLNHSEFEMISNNITYLLKLDNLDGSSENNTEAITYGFRIKSTQIIEYFLVIQNKGETSIWIQYYLSVFPFSYNLGLLILIFSSLIVSTVLIYILTGIKRYFTVAIGINVFIIFFRMITLEKYNLIGLQFSYDFIIPELFTPELYNDYEFWYQAWIDPFLKGVFPYGNINGYEFPPLFIITLATFELIPFLPVWKSAIPIFGSYLLTGILVYLIVRRIKPNHEDSATYAMLIYYLNPITIVYGSFCWFNPGLFVFFVVLAFYILIQKKTLIFFDKLQITSLNLSMIVLGIATMYKQFAFIFLVPFMMIDYGLRKKRNFVIKEYYEKGIIFIKGVIAYIVPIFIAILPFGLVDISAVIDLTIFQPSIFGLYRTKIVNYSYPVNFDTFFVVFGFPDLVTDFIGVLIIFWVPIIISTLLIYYYIWREVIKEEEFSFKNLILWLVILILCIHLFYPRGVFKFYLLLVTPFFGIYASTVLNENPRRKMIQLTSCFGLFLLIVLINRFVYFNILVVLLAYLIYQVIQTRKNRLKKMVETKNDRNLSQ